MADIVIGALYEGGTVPNDNEAPARPHAVALSLSTRSNLLPPLGGQVIGYPLGS